MLGAIKHALANLANPLGRDSRQTFGYWVLAVVVVRFAAGLALSAPLTLKIMASAAQATRSGAVRDPAAIQALTLQIVTAELPRMVWGGVAIGAATMALLAMSVVRRLHDSDLSGWLVLLPGAIYGYALARMPAQIERVTALLSQPDPHNPPNAMALIQADGALALLPYVPLALLAWIALRRSSTDPNRFGAAPVRL